jgi:hypothetical protein
MGKLDSTCTAPTTLPLIPAAWLAICAYREGPEAFLAAAATSSSNPGHSLKSSGKGWHRFSPTLFCSRQNKVVKTRFN